MYNKIEEEFAKRSWYKEHTRFILIVLIVSFIVSMGLIVLGKLLWAYLLSLLSFPIHYTYIYSSLKKHRSKLVKPFCHIKANLKLYSKERKAFDIQLLIEICKSSNIDTRPKVLEAIRHYQVLIPRNIIGSGVFLSLVALIFSIITLSLDSNNYFSSERLGFNLSILLFIGLFYCFYKFVYDQYSSIYSSKAFIIRMEGLLTTIYFQSLIK